MGAQRRVTFGIVYIDGDAAVSNRNFEASDDDHIVQNM
jgi:hypothetical protein